MNIRELKGGNMFIRILLALMMVSSPAWANQWRAGTGENTILGSSNASDIDANSYNSIVKPLDNLLSTYCNEYLTYTSSSTLTVSAGSVVVSNSAGTIRLMLQDSAATVISSANLDSGAFASGTTYYVYATAATNAATASTYFISTSNTAPSGQTYYYKIGSFIMDGSTHITTIANAYNDTHMGTWTSKTSGTIYQALTDGIVISYISGYIGNGETFSVVSDSSSAPSTVRCSATTPSSTTAFSTSCNVPVRRGDYYQVTENAAGGSAVVYFMPIGQ